jgi:CHAT domain-containing protein
MRLLFFLVFSLLFTSSQSAENKEDSLAIEAIRKEAENLAREGNIIESIDKVERAIARSTSLKLSEYFINERLRLFLANRYSNIGDFDRAIELAIGLELFYKENKDLSNELDVKNNLGVYNLNIGRSEVAYRYFIEAWQILQKGDDVIDQLDGLDGLAASCIELGRTTEAKNYLNKAEQLLKVCPLKWKENLEVYYLVNHAKHALATSNEAEAEKSLLRCIELAEKLNIRKGANAYQLLAELFLRQGKSQEALYCAKQTLRLLGDNGSSSVKDPYLLQSYLIQAKAHLALGNYEAVIENCKKAEKQAAFFQHKYIFNESKLYLGALRREGMETGVLALYELYRQSKKQEYLEEALVYAERAKSNLLNERWNKQKKLSLDKRQDAVSLHYKLIFQINKLEGEEDKQSLIKLRNQLDSLNEVLGVKNDSPFLTKDLKNFQGQLEEEELYLVYMHIDTLVFRFDIRKNRIDWERQLLPKSESVIQFYHVLRTPSSTEDEFLKAAEDLSALLPSSLLKQSSVKAVHIVPDGILNYLLFDLIPLDFKAVSWKEMPYAGLNYHFSYDFSLQSSQIAKKPNSLNQYIGFAPDYKHLDDWASLNKGYAIMTLATTLFEGQSYLGEAATESNFQTQSPQADLLHLYAHGVSNDSTYKTSYLVLQDDKIYVDEILALPLKAKLCILTACQVGLGKTFNGEGITGIAWSFKAAGVENVIQSMWKLNEESSAILMPSFLKHFVAGDNSTVALSKSKMEYLNNPEVSERLKHPYYWAGIGHYGHGTTWLQSSSQNWPLLLLGISILLGFLFIRIWLRKSS